MTVKTPGSKPKRWVFTGKLPKLDNFTVTDNDDRSGLKCDSDSVTGEIISLNGYLRKCVIGSRVPAQLL